jgi:hypothetical protein
MLAYRLISPKNRRARNVPAIERAAGLQRRDGTSSGLMHQRKSQRQGVTGLNIYSMIVAIVGSIVVERL